MYILSTILSGVVLGVFVTYYYRLVNWMFSFSDLPCQWEDKTGEDVVVSDNEGDADDDPHESEYETTSDEEKNYVTITYTSQFINKEMPCYMKDFYAETTLSNEWFSKTDDEKREILDRQLDEYKNNTININISNTLREIKC
jgi:hypothetical protein